MPDQVPQYVLTLQRLDAIEARLAALEGACGTDLATLEANAGQALIATRRDDDDDDDDDD